MNFFKKILTKITGEKPKEIKEEAYAKTETQTLTESKTEEKKLETNIRKEKTDEELIAELNDLAPGIFSQAKTPEMKKMILNIYKKMIEDGVNVKDEKAVEKWMQENAHLFQGGDVPKVETYKREKPKVGRNDPCPCGSGKKYKKCCGSKEQ